MRVRDVVLIAIGAWFLSNIIWAFVYVEDHAAARQAQIEAAQYPANCPVSQ